MKEQIMIKKMTLVLAFAMPLAAVFIMVGCVSNEGGTDDEGKETLKDNVVRVSGGLIKGYSSLDGAVAIYKGIPYAADTGGQNRFKAPQNVTPWDGVKDCTDWGNSAVQTPQEPFMFWTEEFIISKKVYSEDCLNLNVWTTGTAEKKPVIMFIHGGGFTSGGSSCDVYDGEDIVRKGVVFVSVNYRVGVFGFLASSELKEENDGYGNFAVLDLIKALEWIKDNISQFGGDPENVTIMGQSAGAGLVQALMVSPKAKGLFQHAVAESYNVIQNPFGNIEAHVEQGDAYNLSPEQLRSMSSDEVFKLEWGMSPPASGTDVIPFSFTEAYRRGTANNVDLISGFVEGDGLLFAPETAADQLEMNMMASQLALAHTVQDSGYSTNVYLYYYNYVMPGENSQSDGAFHTSEVPYFFNHLSSSRASYWTDSDRKVGGTMSDYLVNFARTGNPNGTGLAAWETVQKSSSYLLLNANPEMR
jgi:para-nitrobenzyl esterase